MAKSILGFLLSFGMSAWCAASSALDSYPKESVHLFLLAGQSNMAGRGSVAAEDQVVHPRIFALNKDGEWELAIDPVHYDKKSAGVGLARTFALELLDRDDNIIIGLIPAACGGSSITKWEPGAYHKQTQSNPYDDAIERTQIAMQDGVLKGILWHQGESDCKPEFAANYEENLSALIHRFREELEAGEVPVLIGQLGQFKPWNDAKKQVNQAHINVAAALPLVEFVPSDGLSSKEDNIHFNADSLREFGRRYAKVYTDLVE